MKKTTWFSTRHAGDAEGVQQLSFQSLQAMVKDAHKVTVVAPYYDERFIGAILDGIKKPQGARFDLLLNVSMGQRGEAERKSIKKIQEKIQAAGANANIGVFAGSALYHTKLLRISNRQGHVYLHGSANATEAGFSFNEELVQVLESDQAHPLLDGYIESLRHVSCSLEQRVEDASIKTLAAFFRDGTMWYAPKSDKQFTLNLNLTPRVLKAYRDQSASVAGVPLIGGNAYNLLHDFMNKPGGNRRTTAKIGKFGSETCYGFWAPWPYNDEIQALINDKSIARKQAAQRFFVEFKKRCSNGSIARVADGQLKRFEKLSREVHEPWKRDSALERLDVKLVKLRRKVDSDAWQKSVLAGYRPCPVPEVWEDPIARQEFEQSFFEGLAVRGESRTQKGRVWDNIEKAVKITPGMEPDELQDALVAFLRSGGWKRDLWGAPDKINAKKPRS